MTARFRVAPLVGRGRAATHLGRPSGRPFAHPGEPYRGGRLPHPVFLASKRSCIAGEQLRSGRLTGAGDVYQLAETETRYGTSGTQVTPPVKTYEGFETPTSQTATIAGDGSTVVEYYYQRKSYDLICHPNNLEPDISDTIRYGSLVVTSPVYWEDHTFRGWYDNPELSGEPCVAGTMPAHDLELWAAWTLNAVIAPEISTELSTGIDATVSAPAWVHGAVWGQLYDPYAHYVGMSFANPPAQGVKTASGHGVIVTSARPQVLRERSRLVLARQLRQLRRPAAE